MALFFHTFTVSFLPAMGLSDALEQIMEKPKTMLQCMSWRL